MRRLILPKNKVEVDGPLIFLAGPIRGAPSWQDDAIEYIHARDPAIHVASPRRDTSDHIAAEALLSDVHFPRQLDWERHYLEYASEKGAILFWLPLAKEATPGKTYARDTRGELGEWRGRSVYNPHIRLAIGGEAEFDGLDVMRRCYEDVIPGFQLYATLEETCDAALRLASK